MPKPIQQSVKALNDQREAMRARVSALQDERASLGIQLASMPSMPEAIRIEFRLSEVSKELNHLLAAIDGIEHLLRDAPALEAEWQAKQMERRQNLAKAAELNEARSIVYKSLAPQLAAIGSTLQTIAEHGREINRLVKTSAMGLEDPVNIEAHDLLGFHTGISSSFETLMFRAGIGDLGILLPQLKPENRTDVPLEQAVDRVIDGARSTISRVQRAVDHA